jgi:hypothetical protein
VKERQELALMEPVIPLVQAKNRQRANITQKRKRKSNSLLLEKKNENHKKQQKHQEQLNKQCLPKTQM